MPDLGPDPYGRRYDRMKVGKKMISTEDINKGTEYGGVAGLIQPAPHDPNDKPKQAISLLYNLDPGARADEPDATLLPITEPKKIQD